jgi:hypothetical protein
MKYFILLLILVGQLAFGQFATAAEPIGRLFTSPAERSNLDHLRQTRKLNAPVKIDAPDIVLEAAPVLLPREVNLQGYVKRNDGKQGTVWVNDEAMQENSSSKGVQVGRLPEDSNRVPMKLSGNGKRLNLKAGQVYDPETNRVREARNHAAQGDSGTVGQPEY